MGDYEKDIEEALASVRLLEQQKKAIRKATCLADLLEFMDTHPEFKQFYNLMKRADTY